MAAKTKLEDSETVELAQYDSIIMQYWQNIVAYGAYTNYYFPSEYEESDLYNICEEPITKTLAYKGIYKRAKTTPAGYTTTTPENATPLQNLVLGGGYVFYINEDWQTSAYQTNVYV